MYEFVIYFYFYFFLISYISSSVTEDFYDFFMMLANQLMLMSCFLLFFRLYFHAPRDCPVRLNCKRQKIYTFDYKRKWWNPWVRWPTTIKAYNWADVHGEIRFSSDRYTGGFQLFGSVCHPGTLNVIERFQIAGGSPAQLHQTWSYLCLYMKGEPVPDEAVNPGRPDFWCSRKADKWPADMERESTTAPDTSYLLCEIKKRKST